MGRWALGIAAELRELIAVGPGALQVLRRYGQDLECLGTWATRCYDKILELSGRANLLELRGRVKAKVRPVGPWGFLQARAWRFLRLELGVFHGSWKARYG